MSGCGGFAHDHVAHLVSAHFYIVVCREFQKKVTYLLLMAGGTRNFCNLIETFPDQFRFKVFYFHKICFLLFGYTCLSVLPRTFAPS